MTDTRPEPLDIRPGCTLSPKWRAEHAQWRQRTIEYWRSHPIEYQEFIDSWVARGRGPRT